MKLIFDVYPLLNRHYTGIPQTTWHLMRKFVEYGVDCIYTIGYRRLNGAEVHRFLKSRSGTGWKEWLVSCVGVDNQQYLSMQDFKERIYFSPHVISCVTSRALGSARIVHDISSITLTQFHTPDAVSVDGNNIIKDLSISDIVFTVSNSSKAELIRYLGVDESKIVVAYPGVEWYLDHVDCSYGSLVDSPYVIVLATNEPRKNINLFLKYLCKNKDKIMENDCVYAFAGPDGWGRFEVGVLQEDLDILVSAKNIKFLGFVPEELKMSLLLDATYMIYPAFFEGFGSPVAEALSLGTPVVSSWGGSLPEVGGSSAYYFSPESMESLESAILDLEYDLKNDRISVRAACYDQGSGFKWSKFTETILKNLTELYVRKS